MDPVSLPDLSVTLDHYDQAWQRLISGAVPQDELASLIETIFSSEKVTERVNRLQGNDVQTFIDVLDAALDGRDLVPYIRRKSMRLLRTMCARHTLVTTSLKIEMYDDPPGPPVCRGGFGEVWEREYRGQKVAVKVLKEYVSRDLQKTIRRFCKEFVPWKALRHPNVLPLLGVIMTETKFAMVSAWMSNGNINQFVTAHQDANRFELLADVARGLVYMHGQGMLHGDLKGANILVDQTRHARLADFGLLTIVSESTASSSFTEGGSMRWMSPELFDSDAYRRTKGSDCYALGMVIYEVLSRRIPFYRYSDFAIVGRVTKGERPERPGIGAFTDAVWEVLELCWKSLPRERPSIEDVLKCMKKAATSWTPAPPLSTAVPLTVDSPTSDTSIISSEESEDVDEGEVPPPSPPSDEFSAPDEPPDHQIPQPQETRSQVANLTPVPSIPFQQQQSTLQPQQSNGFLSPSLGPGFGGTLGPGLVPRPPGFSGGGSLPVRHLTAQPTGFVDPRLAMMSNTFVPANPSLPYQGGVPQFQPQTGSSLGQNFQQHNQTQRGTTAPKVPWTLSKAEKKSYDQIFRAWDTSGSGFISGQTALEVFGQSGLDRNDLAWIWALADTDSGGKLNMAEFQVAMGLIYRKLNGNEIPEQLPKELVPASAQDLQSVNFVKGILKNETRGRSPGNVDDSISKLPTRSFQPDKASGAGDRRGVIIHKYRGDDHTSPGSVHQPRLHHIDRDTVRTRSDDPTDDLSVTKHQLENKAKMLDRATEENIARTREDDDLEREMSDLRYRIKRLQDDLDYVSRGPRSLAKDDERRKLEREFLHLMHEKLPDLERRIEENQARKDKKKREQMRNLNRSRDNDRDRDYRRPPSQDTRSPPPPPSSSTLANIAKMTKEAPTPTPAVSSLAKRPAPPPPKRRSRPPPPPTKPSRTTAPPAPTPPAPAISRPIPPPQPDPEEERIERLESESRKRREAMQARLRALEEEEQAARDAEAEFKQRRQALSRRTPIDPHSTPVSPLPPP